MKRKRTLKWNMIGMLVLVWLLPLTLASCVMFFYVSQKLKNHMEENIVISSEKAADICEMRFSDAVGASRNASYLNVIRNGYYDYQNSQDNPEQKKRQLYNTVTNFLNDQYRYNTAFLTSMLYFQDQPEEIYYTYSNMKAGTFDRVQIFREKALEKVQEGTRDLDTGILLLNVDGNLYMARNMMTPQFEPFAVLVMELDKEAMFKSLESVIGYKGYAIYVDGEKIADSEPADYREEKNNTDSHQLYELYALDRKKDTGKNTEKMPSIYRFGEQNSYVHHTLRFEGHDLEFFAGLDSLAIMSEQNFIPYIVAIFVLSMIPLILLVLWFFHREVTRPVTSLVSAAGEIEKGNLGYEMPQIGNSLELSYLGESFNRMSAELKHQFDTIYSEELALRDARIKALQSQINPHFLNNTLEIINWEARMNGNFKVSGMIEALSTMLEATLNRSKASFISLADELNYMDAYLYIVERRFEDKLKVHRNIDESLLTVRIPRLIIQPIVENAVEHGMDEENRILIDITIQSAGENGLEIEIKNHGMMKPEDKKKVEKLLKGETEQQEKSINLGIRNVNQRLKIIYNESCGLTIENDLRGYTVSTLRLLKTIPKSQEHV